MHDGRYETILGSDVARDGMFLELWDRPSNELALWAFFSDADGSFEVTRYRADVPLEVEAWFQAAARRRLPPVASGYPLARRHVHEHDHDDRRHTDLLQGLGHGTAVVFSHGWLLSADAFEDQMFFLASRGYRCSGHGRSIQPWQGNDMDAYADDLATLVAALDLRNAIHVDHSTGGGQVARYIGRHGTQRVAKAVLIGAITPLMLQTPTNPAGTPIEVFDQLRASVVADRSQFWKDLSLPFYGYNRSDATVSQGLRDSFWLQGMMTGFPAAYFCIKAFSETDLTEDLKKFDVPTLILHGDDDQIVPIGASAMLSSKLIKNVTLKVYKGAPHGMCSTHKHQVNEDLLAFIKG